MIPVSNQVRRLLRKSLGATGAKLILVSVFLLTGCAMATSFMPRTDEYTRALNAATRNSTVYKDLESRLFIQATYKTEAFRTAYVNEYARLFQLDDDAKKTLLDREIAVHEGYNEFFFSAYTPLFKWNDFDQKNSIWKLYLTDGNGGKTFPVEIKKVDYSDPTNRSFFPYLDYWSSAYMVKFPRIDTSGKISISEKDSAQVKLIVTGILGTTEMVWKFERK